MIEITFIQKEQEMRFKPPQISHAVAGLILNLTFNTKDPDGFRDTVNILLFLKLSLSVSSEAALVIGWWDTEVYSSTLTTYTKTASLLHSQKVAPIVLW